jgi:hypothetical protein
MQTSMMRVRKLASRARMFISLIGVVLFALILLTLGFAVVRPDQLRLIINEQFSAGHVDPLSAGAATAIVLLLVVQFALGLWGLLQLRQAFGMIARSEALNSQPAKHVRSAGIFFALSAIATNISNSVISVIVSSSGNSQSWSADIGINGDLIMALLMAVTLIVFAHIIFIAGHISDDNKMIV